MTSLMLSVLAALLALAGRPEEPTSTDFDERHLSESLASEVAASNAATARAIAALDQD